MKKILVAIGILFSVSATAQGYADSLATFQLSQRAALVIGHYIKTLPAEAAWGNRNAPTTLKNYVGTGTRQDSLFTVTLKAIYITGMIDILLTASNEVIQADRLSIINNSPTIPGYTSLASQVVSKAAGNTSEKQVAQYILDYYNAKVAEALNINTNRKLEVVQWANN
jgi:hypothetical protein